MFKHIFINSQASDEHRKAKVLRWRKRILDSYVASAHCLRIDSREALKFLTENADEIIPYDHWNVGLFASIKQGTELKNEAGFRVKDYWPKTDIQRLWNIKSINSHEIANYDELSVGFSI